MPKNLLLFLLLIISSTIFGQNNCPQGRYVNEIFSSVSKTEGVQFGSSDPYGLLNNQDLYLDVFEPVGDTLPKRPLVLHQFGGGFLIGWRTEPVIPQMGESYAKRGFVFATIDYRLGFNPLDGQSAERAVYRAAQDLRASLRFLVDNADTYGIDTSRIFLTGTSAGCLSAFVNTYMNESDRVDLPSTYGIFLEPQDLGCANCSGNNNFNNQEVPVKGIINNWGAILDTNYIDIATDPADNVPVISFHGTEDFIVPYDEGSPFSLPIFPTVQGSLLIHERLTNQGIKNRLYPLVGLGHEPQLLQLQGWVTDTILQLGSEFLHEIMQPQTSAIAGAPTSCVGSTEMYSVDYHNFSNYCWEVTGGSILMNNDTTILVEWTALGQAEIHVQEYNEVHAINEEFLTVDIGTPPDTVFSYTSNDGLFQFDNSANGIAFNWNFGDGNTDTAQNALHQYADTGSFDVALTVTNSFCALTAMQTIVSDLCPVANFAVSYQDTNVIFTNTSSFDTNIEWIFPNGSNQTGETAITQLPNGMQTITVIASNNFCTDTLTLDVDIDNCPVADFTVTTSGLTANITNNSANQSISFWDFGEGSTSSIPNPSFIYNSAGNYDIQLIVYNSALCSDTIIVTVNVNDRSDTTGIKDREVNNNLVNIYPNPSVDLIYIQLPAEATGEQVRVINQTGKISRMFNYTDHVSLRNLPNGIYFIEVITDKFTSIKKVVKN